jgi:hypothetical protein
MDGVAGGGDDTPVAHLSVRLVRTLLQGTAEASRDASGGPSRRLIQDRQKKRSPGRKRSPGEEKAVGMRACLGAQQHDPSPRLGQGCDGVVMRRRRDVKKRRGSREGGAATVVNVEHS